MSGPAGFLEFFILEASDYVEQLDRMLLGGGQTGPDAEGVQRVARALRGTATMAKIPAFAELASGVERLGRAMQEGAVQWNPALGGVLVAAIDDLKTLLHSSRTWSTDDDRRARARTAELEQFTPGATVAGSVSRAAPDASLAASPFLATEAANIAAGLELLTAHAGDADTAANVLRRVRALRGVAGVKEVVPLADVLEATEDAARELEMTREPLSDAARDVLVHAAGHLRALSSALRTGGDMSAMTAERTAFAAAHEAWSGREGQRELVVPIADLYYNDGQAGVVETAANPPTSASQRFRMELVSLGEHLAQVVAGARSAADAESSTRARRDLRRALTALQGAAQSFGEHDVAEFIGTHVDSADHIDFLGLAALDDLASLLLEPGTAGARLSERLREIVGGRDLAAAIGAGFGSEPPADTGAPAPAPFAGAPAFVEPARRPDPTPPPAAQPPAAQPPAAQPPAAQPPAPHGASSREPGMVAPLAEPVVGAGPPSSPLTEKLDLVSAQLIDSSIAALDALEATPFSDPVPIPEDAVVSIESLLYRGGAALDRAVEIRDELRARPGSDAGALEELFDLLELARAN